jgi:mannose/fructose/N-acetylgalactosamine-specific phosphotransferase system component IIB
MRKIDWKEKADDRSCLLVVQESLASKGQLTQTDLCQAEPTSIKASQHHVKDHANSFGYK